MADSNNVDESSNMNTYTDHIRQSIIPILKRYGVTKAALFGSAVKGKGAPGDIDILVQIDEDVSLLQFVALKLELEQVLQKSVDLVEYDTIKPRLRESILREQEAIL